MLKKRMSHAVRKGAVDDAVTRNEDAVKGGERLTDSITGSLRVEGYDVKREEVAEAVQQIVGRHKP
ncbi:hypothetical protein [Deinococcus ficus]|uniref:hypothetical protein n=1 Tax=Deinococcus ficus TaxID=317577 RepID=UPI00131B2098|nr:hypothetical protein [Deinococcus ficus]